MRNLFLSIALLICSISSAQFLQVNDKEDAQIIAWLDPTFTDAGIHIGVEVNKQLLWGWVSLGVSHYEALNPSYTDLIGSGGFNFTMFEKQTIRIYTGPRIGVSYRDGNPYPLVGGVLGFEVDFGNGFTGGLRGWIDWREDQKDEFFGDEDAYKPGLITDHPLLQENGAIVFGFKF